MCIAQYCTHQANPGPYGTKQLFAMHNSVDPTGGRLRFQSLKLPFQVSIVRRLAGRQPDSAFAKGVVTTTVHGLVSQHTQECYHLVD